MFRTDCLSIIGPIIIHMWLISIALAIPIYVECYVVSRVHVNSFPNRFCIVIVPVLILVFLSRYNNRTYRVDDIDWSKTPQDKFDTALSGHTGKEGRRFSYTAGS